MLSRLQGEKSSLLDLEPVVALANMMKLPFGDPLSVNGVQLSTIPSSSCCESCSILYSILCSILCNIFVNDVVGERDTFMAYLILYWL